MITQYLQEVNRSMQMLAQHDKVLFVGQAVKYRGTAITRQLEDVSEDKKIELPVIEDFQAGFCLGLALRGYIPVCIYPRFNFALLACNQIVNHIDKWPIISHGKSKPKVIIKIAVGSPEPLDPGSQHKGNYTDAFKSMCDTINIIELTETKHVYSTYEKALNRTDGISTIIVEHSYQYAYGPLWKMP